MMWIVAWQVGCLLQAAPTPILTPPVFPVVRVEGQPNPPTPTPIQDVAGFVRDHSVTVLVQTGEGRLIRKGQAVLSTPEGYIVTALGLVVGGSTFVVSGGLVGNARHARALAVSRRGKLAVLQLEVKENEQIGDRTPRTNVAPGVGDRLFAVREDGSSVQGRVLAALEEADGTRLMKTNLTLAPGTPVFNFRGQWIGIHRGGSRAQPEAVVFVPASIPGDWVDYFPSSLREPIRKKAVEPSSPN